MIRDALDFLTTCLYISRKTRSFNEKFLSIHFAVGDVSLMHTQRFFELTLNSADIGVQRYATKLQKLERLNTIFSLWL